ncbi:MAG: hypothetical protein JWQ66_2629 [Mucilaginibacter sp.]|jgi:hypothetical protein|nr:hypothetical protein [Mucilaginibacter sp.]
MVSFTVVLQIYNSPLALVVTPLAMMPYSFLVKTLSDKGNSMIIKRLPNHNWIGEKVTMKYFTKKNIQRLGRLIETKNKELLVLNRPA